ncbi:MAG: type II toxin-antitoxin system VapC family toxin [Syntrophobacteraceae bacterium]
MNISYLVDTDWIIHYLSGVESIVEKLQALQKEGLAVSIISLAELYEGVYSSKDSQAAQKGIDDFLKNVSVVDINEEICQIFGRERSRLRKQGNLIGDFDLLIAATSLNYELTLLTNNLKHFERVEGLRLISLP